MLGNPGGGREKSIADTAGFSTGTSGGSCCCC